MRKFLFLAAVTVAGAAFAEGDGEGLVEERSCNAWHFRIGPVLSPRVRVSVHGPRVVLPTRPPAGWRAEGTTGNVIPDDPAVTRYANRRYVDGYVNPDEGTTATDSLTADLTWDWGALDVPSQYSAADKTMNFHTDATRWTESFTATSFSGGSNSEGDRDLLVGVEALGGWTFFNDNTFDAAVDAGFRFYGSGYLDASSRYGSSVTTTRTYYRFVDSYDASGWTGAIPTGPYDAGTPEGPARVIGAVPTRRAQEDALPVDPADSRTYDHYYVGDTRLIYRIWDLRLGPTLGWQATDYLTIRGGVYGLLGLVDATLKTDAATSGGPSGASASTCGALFGMAFGASAQLNLTDTLFLYGSAEYDWWTDSVDLNAGGAGAEIKLSDFVISLGLGVEF